jgi:uncharacterized membrane protein YraQ (UPF0718 family)
MRGTWETTEGGGGGGLGVVVLIIVAAALVGPAVAAAVAGLLHLLVIAAVALVAVAAAGLVALVAYRVSHKGQESRETARGLYRVTPAPARPSPLRSEPRPAIEAPRQVHLHFHGADPAEVAAIIRSQREDPP